ncbi:MAG: ferritin-like domain-containing protein [Deltaproteobacteria bacterium]|nr:ferritin-like domain-containing protein [Deltaproteobacteria bacterium]
MALLASTRVLARVVRRAVSNSLHARVGRFRDWPNDALLIDEPLALAEQQTDRLRRIYANAQRDAWDGPALFREAMARHGGIQLAREQREALAHPISMLMWGELAAWIVAAELATRLEEPDARLAASAQVFDEARHFYVLRDYLAALHVPVPKLDPYFAIAARRLLATRDLTVKLFAMQILAEGTAMVIFRFLADAKIEPVLTELLPYIEKDEARHVGLGVLYLPERLRGRPVKELLRIRDLTYGIGDLFGATQIRFAKHYAALGADPRDLIRSADKMLHELSQKIGPIPGTELEFFPTNPTKAPDYEKNLDLVLPRPGQEGRLLGRVLRGVIEFGARRLPA